MKRTLLSALLLLAVSISHADPQTTAFTYQGSLTANGAPANGNFDLTFRLFDAATGGGQIGASIPIASFPVVNGRFTTDLDFPSAFAGQQRWIEVTVAGQTLSPRQPIDSVPVAQFALNGVPGPRGPAGPSGQQIVAASTTIAAGITIVGTLYCPAGKVPSGGGWVTTDLNAGVNVISSGPTSDGLAWTGGMRNTSTTTSTLTLSVICIASTAAKPADPGVSAFTTIGG